MKTNGKNRILPRLLLLAATVIWGSSFVIVKDTVDKIPPNFLLAIRFSFGALVLAILFCRRFKKLNRGYLWRGALMGTFLFLAYCTQTLGIRDTTPGKNAFLTAVYCILVPFVYWVVDRTRPSAVNFVAAVMGLAGIGLVSLQGSFSVNKGDVLTLIGGVLYAFHMVTVAKASKGRDIFLLTVIQFAASAILAWIATAVFETIPREMSLMTWSSIAYLAILCTAVALLLQNVGQQHTPPTQASLILSLESVFGVAFSVALGKESLTVPMIVGFGLILAAILMNELLAGLGKRKKKT